MYQWPLPINYSLSFANKKTRKKISYIENFFSKKYKSKYAILTSSGRSSINLILKYFNFDRSKIVNLPLWTSACLIQSIGSFSNVSVKKNDSDCFVIVHKWGNTYKINKNEKKKLKKKIIIDDSADTIPGKKYKPFENSQNYEILSLPKLIGSFCGGIILTNDLKLYKFTKKFQLNKESLAKSQTIKKFKSAFKKNSSDAWRYYESFNDSIDFILVNNVYKNIKNFNINYKTILLRQILLKKYFKNIKFDKKRIGPCLILDKKKYGKKYEKILETKHFNFNFKSLKEKYKECYILPIHFGISNKNFKNILNKLIKLRA